MRDNFVLRFTFCCGQCRKRITAASVRFLARRLAQQLSVSARTVERWRQWWRKSFPVTHLWQTMCARFMPPRDVDSLPAALLTRFAGVGDEPIRRLLMFLTPLTGTVPITLREGQ